jgi:hypothetical protein
MKKTSKLKAKGKSDEMLPNYDFSSGTHGKHFKKYREGVTVRLLVEAPPKFGKKKTT